MATRPRPRTINPDAHAQRGQRGHAPVFTPEELGIVRRDNPDADDASDRAMIDGVPVDMAAAFPNPLLEPDDYSPGAGLLPPLRDTPDPDNETAQTSMVNGGYMREYELKLLHRLLMRNVALHLIAQQMGKSITEVQRLRRLLHRRIRHEAGNVDMLTHAGSTMAFFREVRGQALRIVTDGSKSVFARMAAAKVALAAENDNQRFLYLSGFYSGAKFLPKTASESAGERRASAMKTALAAVMNDSVTEDEMDGIVGRALGDDEADALDDDFDPDTMVM